MDLFTLVSVLIMGSATLCGFGLLLSLIFMERNATASASAAERTTPCRRARHRKGVLARPPAARTAGAAMPPSARRTAARRNPSHS
jgi:hypothetical protein